MASEWIIMVGTDPSNLAAVLTPDDYSWGLQDVSASDSGRVNDANATMYKNRFTQKRKIQLKWNNPNAETTAAILQAFNPEYVYVRYLDPMDNAYEVRVFYVGDRSAMLKQRTEFWTLYSSVSFDIIER